MADWLLFFHILGAAGWIGAGFFAFYMFPRLARSGSPGAAESIATITKGASVYFGIVTGVLLLSGIGLVLVSDAYGWTQAFVLVGLGAFLLSGIWRGVAGKNSDEQIIEAADVSGPQAEAAVRKWRTVSAVEIVILLVTVWAMMVKLGT